MRTNGLYLGVILVILIVVIAYFAWRRWKKGHKDGFSYSTPATPRVREAIGDLFAGLRRMVALGSQFEARAAALPDATRLAGPRQSASVLVDVLNTTQSTLSGAPPTYANYLAIYRGLTSTDQELLSAADAYTTAGYQVNQDIALSQDGAQSGGYADVANDLIEMGRQLRLLVGRVHRLGVALDVE